jgi:hypothetical protein
MHRCLTSWSRGLAVVLAVELPEALQRSGLSEGLAGSGAELVERVPGVREMAVHLLQPPLVALHVLLVLAVDYPRASSGCASWGERKKKTSERVFSTTLKMGIRFKSPPKKREGCAKYYAELWPSLSESTANDWL